MEERSFLTSIDGAELKDMVAAAEKTLKSQAAAIDALNVFPVPDGDTGTNMLLTLQAAREEADKTKGKKAGSVAEALAAGALFGARGNSGVILSQILQGFAKGVEDREVITPPVLAAAIQGGSELAYRAVSHPVEGTMLSVIRAMAEAARQFDSEENLPVLFTAMIEAAEAAVAATPRQLEILQAAGVVDAGGRGLYVIAYGILNYLGNKYEGFKIKGLTDSFGGPPVVRRVPGTVSRKTPYGYCTDFLLKTHGSGKRLRPDRIRSRLKHMGESVMVVGNPAAIRIHIHSPKPSRIISYAERLGTLHNIEIHNMDEQHQTYLAQGQTSGLLSGTAVIAVVSGDGLAAIFTGLGAGQILYNGSKTILDAADFINAAGSTTAEQVILLPNNKDLITAAEQAAERSSKTAVVVPTRNIPQGVAAMMAYNYNDDLLMNADCMKKALKQPRCLELVRTKHSMRDQGLRIKRNQIIGFLDSSLKAVGADLKEALRPLLVESDAESYEIMTVYRGADAKLEETHTLMTYLRERCPHQQIEAVSGGQTTSLFIISLE